MEADHLEEVAEHERRAALRALFRNDLQIRGEAALERAETALIDLSSLANDTDRRSIFLADVGKRVVARGSAETVLYLRRVFKFSKDEASAVVREARKELTQGLTTQTEELRAVAEARLETLMRRADAACDLTNYGRALKEWIRLHGLFRQDDTTMGDFSELIRRVTDASVPGAKVIDAEFEASEPEVTPWTPPPSFAPVPDEEEQDEFA